MADQGAATAHTVFRVLQVLTLIPAWALLAAIMDWYNKNDQETPGSIITLFVFCILGSVWAFCILIVTNRAHNTALWIVFWDIVGFAGLIAGVATTSNMANTECGNNNQQIVYITDDGRRVTADNIEVGDEDSPWTNRDNCNLLKAAWGLAIANIIMFFITAILAGVIYRQNQEADKHRDEAVIVEEALPPAGVVREKVYTTTDDGYEEYAPRRPRRSHSRRHERRDRSYDRSEYSVERSRSRSRRPSRAASSGRGHRSSRSVPASRDGY